MLPCLDRDVARNTSQAISKLVACRAFSSGSQVLQVPSSDESMLQQLRALQLCSVVELISEEADHSKWRFSQLGSANLRVAQAVHDPEPVFRALTDFSLENLEAASGWQLFSALCEQGF